MDVRKVVYSNFKSLRNETLDLAGINGAFLVLGMINGDPGLSNGAGKSSMVEGYVWCVFGESPLKSDDELITTGEDTMSVQTEYVSNGNNYVIYRKRIRGKKTELLFTENGRSLTENSVKATQAVIHEKLLSYNLYLNTGYFKQQEFDVLARQTPANRKAILMELLPLLIYSKGLEAVKAYISSLEKDIYAKEQSLSDIDLKVIETQLETCGLLIATLRGRVEQDTATIKGLTAELDGYQQEYGKFQGKLQMLESMTDELKKATREVEMIETQIGNNRRAKENEISNTKSEIGKCQDQIGGKVRIDSILAEIEAEVKKIATVKIEVAQLTEERRGLTEQGIVIQRNIPALKAEVDKLRNKYKALAEVETPDCPLCGSLLDTEKVGKVLKDIEEEGKAKKAQMEGLEEDLKAIGEKVRAVDENIKRHESSLQREREIEKDKKKYEAMLVDIQIAENRLQYMKDQQQQIEAKYASDDTMITSMRDEKIKHKADLEKKVKAIDIDKTAVNKVAFAIEEKQAQIKMKQRGIEDTMQEIGKSEQFIKQHEETKKKFAVDSQRLVEMKDEMFIYEQLARAFGKDGIPALILENVIPEIEIEANAIMARLSSGKMRISLLTQREKKAGGLTETLDIVISDDKGSRAYESYSGGERMRINMAIRLALSKILCRRSGTKIETVIIDEVDALDDAGVRGFVSVINDMQNMFKKIIIISHISELKEYFKQTITVNKTLEGSKIIV